MNRFNLDANNFEEVKEYYENRAIQLLKYGIHFSQLIRLDYGAMAYFYDYDTEYVSLYIYKGYRGRGLYKQFLKKVDRMILTSNDCKIEPYLKENKADYFCVNLDYSPAYEIIQDYYGC